MTLVAVTKTFPVEAIRSAAAAGQRVFGENRVQEGVAKIFKLRDELPEVQWHLIGHLQTNKVKAAVQVFSLIESVDSLRLASRLDRYAGAAGKRLPILLEVNVAGEASKSGFAPDGLPLVVGQILGLPNLEVSGLMTVAPLVSDPEDARWVFRSLRALRERLRAQFPLEEFPELSMGMSDDFEVAVEEGATMVRIGRALFGERPTVSETG